MAEKGSDDPVYMEIARTLFIRPDTYPARSRARRVVSGHAYNRGLHWHERVKMPQWRSDHLDDLRRGLLD